MQLIQLQTFLIATTINILLYVFSGSLGFSDQFRSLNLEIQCYALAQSIGTSFLCLSGYFVAAIIDLFRKRHRAKGWLLCMCASVLCIYIMLLILPANNSYRPLEKTWGDGGILSHYHLTLTE